MKTETRQPRIGADRVKDAMHRGVFTCEREDALSEVAATMARELVHCVVVESGSGEAGPPWGIVSDLDLVAAASVRDLDDQSAGGSAGTPVVTVSPAETLERAAQLMTEHNTAHLIVVDPSEQRPLGVLSTLDIAASLVEGEQLMKTQTAPHICSTASSAVSTLRRGSHGGAESPAWSLRPTARSHSSPRTTPRSRSTRAGTWRRCWSELARRGRRARSSGVAPRRSLSIHWRRSSWRAIRCSVCWPRSPGRTRPPWSSAATALSRATGIALGAVSTSSPA